MNPKKDSEEESFYDAKSAHDIEHVNTNSIPDERPFQAPKLSPYAPMPPLPPPPPPPVDGSVASTHFNSHHEQGINPEMLLPPTRSVQNSNASNISQNAFMFRESTDHGRKSNNNSKSTNRGNREFTGNPMTSGNQSLQQNHADESKLGNPYQFAFRQNGEEGSSVMKIHYEDEPGLRTLPHQKIGTKGDSSLRPNTGLTNSYDYSLWGMAPHELLRFLQRLDMVASLGCVVMASLSWLGKLMFLQLDKFVLMAYLAVLSFSLGMVDLMAIVTPEQQRLIPTNFMGRVRDQLGFLFHPWGKALFVLLLATMCWGIGGLLISLVGGVYFVSSIGWFYAAIAYREDAPRLMGSIDDTYIAETRRRNVSSRTFSISSWDALMRGQAATAVAEKSWVNWISTNMIREEIYDPLHQNADKDKEEDGEGTPLIGNQKN